MVDDFAVLASHFLSFYIFIPPSFVILSFFPPSGGSFLPPPALRAVVPVASSLSPLLFLVCSPLNPRRLLPSSTSKL